MPSIPQFFPGLPDNPAIALLRSYRQWVGWQPRIVEGVVKKIPINPHTGGNAQSTNKSTWGDYEQALNRAWRDHLPGVGFSLDPDDGFVGYDLDKCVRDGRIDEWAKKILALAETYAEISPSGTGIRLIGIGKVATAARHTPAGVEIYGTGRYLTITGAHIKGTPVDILPSPKTTEALLARIEEIRGEPVRLNISSSSAILDTTIGNGFFRTVNDLAIRNYSVWVPALFGSKAKRVASTGGYRVSSKDLGRVLEEDISIDPRGIVDFGYHDMGDSRDGKRTPIDLVEEFTGKVKAKDAAFWLCERLGVKPSSLGWQEDDPVAAVSRLNLAAKVAPEVIEPPIEEPAHRGPALDTADLEDFRFDGNAYAPDAIGGVIGTVARHILETALFPVADFACMAALVFGSALYGRRWAEPMTGGGLNIYVIATAPTGWGKDHPLQEPRQLAWRCEMMHLLGPDEFKSDSAIEKTLRRCPVRACFMDEIGIVLQANASRNAPSWERRVRKAILQVYSSSKGMWTGSQAAGDEGDKGSEPIHRPVLSIYGTSTPEELYKGLTEDNVRDGLFGRMIFASPDVKSRRQTPGVGRYEEIRMLTESVRNFTPEQVSQKDRGLYHANARNALIVPPMVRVPATSDALAALETILGWQRDLTEREFDLASIANRASENVGKLATLRALSRDHAAPLVGYPDVQWAWSIIERSLAVIASGIEKHMVGSESEALMKAIRFHLSEAGKEGLKFSQMIRRRGVSRARPSDVNAALKMLQEAGDVVLEKTGKRGFRILFSGGS